MLNKLHNESVSAPGQPAAEAAPGSSGVGTELAPSPQGGGVRDLATLDRKSAREKASSPYPKVKPDKAKPADSSAAGDPLIEELDSFLPKDSSSPARPGDGDTASGKVHVSPAGPAAGNSKLAANR